MTKPKNACPKPDSSSPLPAASFLQTDSANSLQPDGSSPLPAASFLQPDSASSLPAASPGAQLAVYYCGGCNPAYDRKPLVTGILDQVSHLNLVAPEDLTPADHLLLVCGCPAICLTERDDLNFPGKKIVIGPEIVNYQQVPQENIIKAVVNILGEE